jgi:tetratricopeptide (TPR) repeat protein
VYWKAIFVGVCAVTASATLVADQWMDLMRQGESLERAGTYKEAADVYQRALRLAETYPPGGEQVPASLTSLGNALDRLGRSADAERHYRTSMKMIADTLGEKSTPYAVLAINLGTHFYEHGEASRAEPLLRRAIGTLSLTVPEDDVRLALGRNCLAGVLMARKAYAEAEPLLVEALSSFDMHPETWRFRKAVAMNNLGVLRRFEGHNEEGLHMIEAALALSEAMLGPDHPMLLGELANLATAYVELHRNEEAGALFQRAVDIAEKRLGPQHPDYGHALSNYAKFLRKTGRKAEAKPLEVRADGILKDSARSNGRGMTIDVSSFR